METVLVFLIHVARTAFVSRADLALENAVLRQQLHGYRRRNKRPKLGPLDRALWVVLRKTWLGWRDSLVFVKPDTVIGWHRQGFRLFWRWRSRAKKPGRPSIPRAHIELIRRLSRENPSWGEDRIADELRLKLGIGHSTSTIRKYMVQGTRRRHGRSWCQFVKSHSEQVFACDFLVQHTVRFEVIYVFVVMEVASRRVALINATSKPTLDWVKGQIRELAALGKRPRFLVHDNDGIFGQFGGRRTARSYRCHLDRWLWEVMGIRGTPTPYRAPNANAYVERFNGTLRREALDHFIFFNEAHVRRVCREYVEFYNRARPSQATGKIPDPHPELEVPPVEEATRVVALPVLGGLQHDYRAAA
jgi:transposase InsO family protein